MSHPYAPAGAQAAQVRFLAWLMFLFAFLPAASSPALAQSRAQVLTTSLLQLQDRHQRAAPAEKAQLAADMAGVAAQRRQALLGLLETQPAEVLRLALPPGTRASLPPEVQAQVESHVDLQGDVTVLYEDYKDSARLRHILQANGKRYNLHFTGKMPNVLTGTRVRVKAVQFGSELVLESGTGSTTLMQVTAPALANTLGNFSTAVLLVNFQDNPSQPYSSSQAYSVVLGTGTQSANDYFHDVSFQQTSLSGNVFGWYTLPLSSSTCDYNQIATSAKSAAGAAGVNLSAYQRFVYVFPAISACGWVGMGTVGGSPANAWINGALNNQVATHEMGHNFGLYHSHALACGTTTIGTNCANREYGDWLDTMGNSNPGHYNAFQKERLGWLNYGVSPTIVTVQAGGSFTLESYETAGSSPKALKVYRSTDPTTGQKSWYYVEYRRASGFDGFLGTNSVTVNSGNVLNGVIIHSATDSQPNSSNLLDTTPATSSTTMADWSDPALTVGKSFTDSGAGLTITTTSAGGTTAGVSVTYGGSSCVHNTPSLTISPNQSATSLPGTAVTYTVTVANNDSSACSATLFSLSGSVPSAWTGSLGSSSLNLAPGASGSTSLVVTSPTTAAAGIYTVNAATASATPATATYIVGTSVSTSQPPVAVNDSASTLRNTPVQIAVLANDSDPAGLPLTIVSTGKPANGTATINTNGTLTYTPKTNFKGSDSFSYIISNGSKTASANVSVQVTQR